MYFKLLLALIQVYKPLPRLLEFLMKLGEEGLGAPGRQLELCLWDVLVDAFGEQDKIGKVFLEFVFVVARIGNDDFVDVGADLGHKAHRCSEVAHFSTSSLLIINIFNLAWVELVKNCGINLAVAK